jgi:hypothetical protein
LARRLFSDIIGTGYVEGEICEISTIRTQENDIQGDIIIVDDVPNTMDAFLAEFPPDEREDWREYFELITKKQELTLDQVILKYREEPLSCNAKFKSWRKRTKG